MRTSRFDRIQQYRYLDRLVINGHLFSEVQIAEYLKLRREFFKSGKDTEIESKSPEKY